MENPANWPPQVTAYIAERMQCSAELLTTPGVHFVTAHRVRQRVWRYVIPLWVMVFEESAVVSSAPELAAAAQGLLAGVKRADLLGDEAMQALQRLVVRWGPLDWFRRALWLYCTRETFTPRLRAPVVWVPPSHPEGRALRERHGGEVFGVFHGRELVSRSSIKIESEAAWEVAVTTTEAHRRRGRGASAVSSTTQYILDHDKPALYHCEVTNEASRGLAESLGYHLFARELAWSVEEMLVPWLWDET